MFPGNAEHGLELHVGGPCLCGALVYAELATRHPDTGGEYAFLSRGMGRGVAFVFAGALWWHLDGSAGRAIANETTLAFIGGGILGVASLRLQRRPLVNLLVGVALAVAAYVALAAAGMTRTRLNWELAPSALA